MHDSTSEQIVARRARQTRLLPPDRLCVQCHALILAAGAVRRRARSTLLRGVHQGGLEEHFDRVVHALEVHVWQPLDRFGGV